MDLNQSKLTRAEWETIEKPVSSDEKIVLDLIMKGYENVELKYNNTKTFLSFTKMESSPSLEYFIFKTYFEDVIQSAINKYGKGSTISNISELNFMNGSEMKHLKSSDSIRIQNAQQNIQNNKDKIFEYVLIDMYVQLLKNFYKKKKDYLYYFYTLTHIRKTAIDNINKFVINYINKTLSIISSGVHIENVIYESYNLIEKNQYLMKYSDMELYSHQKKIFTLFSRLAGVDKFNEDLDTEIKTYENEIKQIKRKNVKWSPDKLYLGEDEEEQNRIIEENKKNKENMFILSQEQEENIEILENKINTLYSQYRTKKPCLVLYTAPTGTGKTLTPIGLSKDHRIIFVCVARHIGMALAKSAISMEKKVAFGFGCNSASDVRLHYFSAVDYTINKRSGGIGKVDHSNGRNVEIMICDVQSYITCMHYMLAFNNSENIITYWDEPTITMDYESHNVHPLIHRNWKENKIPHLVLSCATLPSENELSNVYQDFRMKFEDAELHNITSYDCKKSIPIMDKDGQCVLPHYLHSDYSEISKCARFCLENKTLLRYFDLREIIRFIQYLQTNNYYDITNSFKSVEDVTMNSLKQAYLDILLEIDESNWKNIYEYLVNTRVKRFDPNTLTKTTSVQDVASSRYGKELTRTTSVFGSSNELSKEPVKNTGGLLATTSDAYTFTDGPTIYLTDNIDKIGQFYIQQSKIDPILFDKIMKKIESNKVLLEKIEKYEEKIEANETTNTSNTDGSVKTSQTRESGRMSNESEKLAYEINRLRKQIKLVNLDASYIPNTKPHQDKWVPNKQIVENAFTADIGESNIEEIMHLNIENNYKVLLLLGIGTFKLHKNARYMEIMKSLADQQKLFMIIASTDYIYGTNYQFCHGFIGKDLMYSTQQKIYQAMGRIGRNNIQQDYTIRFRDNDMLLRLFHKSTNNLEVINMCKLFTSEELEFE